MPKVTRHQLWTGKTRLPFLVGKFDDVVNTLLKTSKTKSLVVLPCTLYDLAMVSSNPFYAEPYAKLDFCTTDGMPLVWWFKGKTNHSVERVYGPDIINLTIQRTDLGRQLILCPNQMVFDILAKKFSQRMKQKQIGLLLVGNIHEQKEKNRIEKYITSFKPRLVWIGVGSPNQVVLGTYLKKRVKHACTFFCVGAAVPFLAGTVRQAPRWMQRAGLEWFFRLSVEPKRLWKRYLVVTPLFLLRQLLGAFKSKSSS